jgi:putative ABC transport system substrate-binding protein
LGFLNSGTAAGYARFAAAFRQGLNEVGYVEGQNVAIEYRWAEGQYDRLPAAMTARFHKSRAGPFHPMARAALASKGTAAAINSRPLATARRRNAALLQTFA